MEGCGIPCNSVNVRLTEAGIEDVVSGFLYIFGTKVEDRSDEGDREEQEQEEETPAETTS